MTRVEKDDVDYGSAYEFHGTELHKNGSQLCGTCPFCNKEDHFYVKQKTGQYSCKRCNEEGNLYTFLTKVHADAVSSTSRNDLESIANMRDGIPISVLKKHGICKSPMGDIMIPYRKPDSDNLVNLKKWNAEKKISYNTPGCNGLFFVRWEASGPIYVCEGEWDALALLNLMTEAEVESPYSIVAVPGAGVFKESWCSNFANREVYFLYDNDHDKENNGRTFNPGKDGMSRAVSVLLQTLKPEQKNKMMINIIDWSQAKNYDQLPDGFDVRDWSIKYTKLQKQQIGFRKLIKLCRPHDASPKKKSYKAIKRDDFFQVVADFQSVLEFGESFIDTLACCFATMISLRIEGNPLWLFVVGPASCGKTTIIEAFESCEDITEHLSKLTPASLVSGWRGEGEDPSLLPRLKNKTLCVKDFTAVLSMSPNDKENLFGMLRDAYDGRFVSTFGNGTQREYTNLYFSILAGVTHAIHAESRTNLGERFLKINLLDDNFDEMKHIKKALSNVGMKPEQKAMLAGSVLGFMNYLVKSPNPIPTISEEFEDRISAISMLVALVRTQVQRSGPNMMSIRPEPEIGSRVATQLKKLALALAIVFGQKEVTEDCYRIVKKVAVDSCVGWQLEIIEAITKFGDWMTVDELSVEMRVHPNQVRKIVEDSMQLEIVTMKKIAKGGKRPNYCYRPSAMVRRLLRDSKVDFGEIEISDTYSNRTLRGNSDE